MPNNISKRLRALRQNIADDLQETDSYSQTAANFGCSISLVEKCAREFGLQPTLVRPEKIIAVLYDLIHKRDLTQTQIAKRHKVSVWAVSKYGRIGESVGFDSRRKRGRPIGSKDKTKRKTSK